MLVGLGLVGQVFVVFLLLHCNGVHLPLHILLIVSESIEKSSSFAMKVLANRWASPAWRQASTVASSLCLGSVGELIYVVLGSNTILDARVKVFCVLYFLGCQRRPHRTLLVDCARSDDVAIPQGTLSNNR